jgi:hypothetical protein
MNRNALELDSNCICGPQVLYIVVCIIGSIVVLWLSSRDTRVSAWFLTTILMFFVIFFSLLRRVLGNKARSQVVQVQNVGFVLRDVWIVATFSNGIWFYQANAIILVYASTSQAMYV